MEEQTKREVLKKEYYLLGIKVITSNKGNNAGKKFGLVNLQKDVYFTDGSYTYSLEDCFISEETAKEFMALQIPTRHKVELELGDVNDLNSKPKLVGIKAI